MTNEEDKLLTSSIKIRQPQGGAESKELHQLIIERLSLSTMISLMPAFGQKIHAYLTVIAYTINTEEVDIGLSKQSKTLPELSRTTKPNAPLVPKTDASQLILIKDPGGGDQKEALWFI